MGEMPVANAKRLLWAGFFCIFAAGGGFAVRGRQLAVFSAIDNLVKGAAGQAVQNMNLMAGLDEKTGLILTGSNP